MRCLFLAVITEDVIDINMTLRRTGKKGLWNDNIVDDWAAILFHFKYNKKCILWKHADLPAKKLPNFYSGDKRLYW